MDGRSRRARRRRAAKSRAAGSAAERGAVVESPRADGVGLSQGLHCGEVCLSGMAGVDGGGKRRCFVDCATNTGSPTDSDGRSSGSVVGGDAPEHGDVWDERVRVIPVPVYGFGGISQSVDGRPHMVREGAERPCAECRLECVKSCLWLSCNRDLMVDCEEDQAIRREVSTELMYSYNAEAAGSEIQQALDHAGLSGEVDTHRVFVSPRLVAQVVVALQMKLGRGAKVNTGPEGPGNIALVRREIPKLLRKYNVRYTDACAQIDYIERCFFEDSTYERVPNWRQRASRRGRFVGWFVKFFKPSYDY